jgi:hypothetical protein
MTDTDSVALLRRSREHLAQIGAVFVNGNAVLSSDGAAPSGIRSHGH